MSGKKIKQLLELTSKSYGIRESSRALQIPFSTARRWIQRCKENGIDHQKATNLSEEALREILRGRHLISRYRLIRGLGKI